jgi:hypothetical protein
MSASRSSSPNLPSSYSPTMTQEFLSSPPSPIFVRQTARKMITAQEINFLVQVLLNKRHTGYYGKYYQELYDTLANKVIWFRGQEFGIIGYRGANYIIEKLGGGVTNPFNSDNIITPRIRDDLKDSGITLETF